MTMTSRQLWKRFKKHYSHCPAIGLALDLSRMNFPDDCFAVMDKPMQRAFAAMADLERGGIANPDEKRMAGHYWLRDAALAPTAELRREIEQTVAAIKSFAANIHCGVIAGMGGPFKNLLLIGIGGSALGPQFVANALSTDEHKYDDVRGKAFLAQARGERRAYPKWVCEERATKPAAKRTAARRVVLFLAWGVVARRLQPHFGGCALLAPSPRPKTTQRTSSYLCSSVLSQPGADKLKPFFFDNTDPDGMEKVLARIGNRLGRTLCVIIQNLHR